MYGTTITRYDKKEVFLPVVVISPGFVFKGMAEYDTEDKAIAEAERMMLKLRSDIVTIMNNNHYFLRNPE